MKTMADEIREHELIRAHVLEEIKARFPELVYLTIQEKVERLEKAEEYLNALLALLDCNDELEFRVLGCGSEDPKVIFPSVGIEVLSHLTKRFK